MFSRRTRWSLAENAIAHQVDAYRRSGRELIDLTETNPTRVGLAWPGELRAAFLAGNPVEYAPEPFGLRGAREAVAAYHGQRVPPEHICLAASTSEAYGWLFKLLCDPGDSVLVPTPGYPLFDYLAAMENVQLVPYRTQRWDDWSIDFEHLESQVSASTRAIVLVSPNNPTGAMIHTSDLTRLIDVCSRHDLALICDEVFAEYADPPPGRVATLAGSNDVVTFVLSGLSKSCLQPQLKGAWIATSGPQDVRDECLRRLEVIADSYLSVSTATQLAMPAVLAMRHELQRPLRERISANRRVLEAQLRGTSATPLPADGGWSAVIRMPATRTDDEWVSTLLESGGVLVHPGFFFDFEEQAFVVLSLIVEEPNFHEAADKLARMVS